MTTSTFANNTTSTEFMFFKEKYGIESPSLKVGYITSLAISTLCCPPLIYKSNQKIKRIMNKESYCVISVGLNILSIINLCIQFMFDIYLFYRIFDQNFKETKHERFVDSF